MNDFASKSKNFSILFQFKFKSLNVNCIYFQKTQTIIIGLSKRNSAWSVDISEGKISERIPNEAYILISDMLKKKKVYSNECFFIALNNALRGLKEEKIKFPSDSEILEGLRQTKTNDKEFDLEGNKPFFHHWRRVKPSLKSLNKIQRYFGKEIRNKCYKNEITAVWSKESTSKSLDFLKNN